MYANSKYKQAIYQYYFIFIENSLTIVCNNTTND